jgi:hypothetical protein
MNQSWSPVIVRLTVSLGNHHVLCSSTRRAVAAADESILVSTTFVNWSSALVTASSS